jgi:hypothetical protein
VSESVPTTPRDERLPILITIVVLGLALSVLIPLPSREWVLDLFGSELSLQFSGPVQMIILMGMLVCIGVDSLLRGGPRELSSTPSQPPVSQIPSLATTAMFWALPSLLAVLALIILHSLPWWGYQVAFALISGAVLATIITWQKATLSVAGMSRRGLRLALNGVAYAVAYVLFAMIFGARLRSMLSATAVMAVSGVLALELLRSSETSAWRPWLYAGLIALIMGEATWVLNYTRVSNRAGGALLVLSFYVLTGLAQQYLWERLNRQVLTEYLVALVFGLGVISLLV